MQQTGQAYDISEFDGVDWHIVAGLIFRRKKIVLSVFLSIVAVVLSWAIVASPVYEVSMIVEPPTNAITDTGVQNWDSIANMKAMILAGVFDAGIIKDMHLSQNTLGFQVVQPKDTRMLKIFMLCPNERFDFGLTALTRLLKALEQSYAEIIRNKRAKISNEEKMIMGQISIREDEIKRNDGQYKILEEREAKLLDEIKSARAHEEKLFARGDATFDRKESDAAALFYASSMQQNMTYLTQLQNDYSELKTKKENLLLANASLRSAIRQSQIEIENQRITEEGVQNISVVQQPMVSIRPVGPKRKETLLVGAFLGLIAGVLAAFLWEIRESASRAVLGAYN